MFYVFIMFWFIEIEIYVYNKLVILLDFKCVWILIFCVKFDILGVICWLSVVFICGIFFFKLNSMFENMINGKIIDRYLFDW